MNYPEEENPWEIDQLMHGIAIKQMEELLAVESSEERVDLGVALQYQLWEWLQSGAKWPALAVWRSIPR